MMKARGRTGSTFERGNNEAPARQINNGNNEGSAFNSNDPGAGAGSDTPSDRQDQMDDGASFKMKAISKRLHAKSRD